MIGKTLYASWHRGCYQGQAMTESLVRSVVSAARKGATALFCLAFFIAVALATPEQTPSKQDQPQAKSGGDAQAKASTKGVRVPDLRGDYEWHRSNNDLLYYHLGIRVDPKEQSFGGKNTIKFRMLKNDCRIQLDLAIRPAEGVAMTTVGEKRKSHHNEICYEHI